MMRDAIASEVGKAAPPAAVTGVAWLVGWSLNELVALATMGYIALQAGYLVWKWIREYRANR